MDQFEAVSVGSLALTLVRGFMFMSLRYSSSDEGIRLVYRSTDYGLPPPLISSPYLSRFTVNTVSFVSAIRAKERQGFKT